MYVRFTRRQVFVVVILTLVILSVFLAPVSAAKNVIIMIGDGMGFKHVEATRNYLGTTLVMESFPVKLAASTYMYGGSYNKKTAAKSFGYLNNGATDSAAAATALATGTKANSGNICTDNGDVNRLTNLTEYARTFNKATSVITMVPFSHATPAGFAAHNNDRGYTGAIAREMITTYGDGPGARGDTPTVDVIIGGGHPDYYGGYIDTAEYNALVNGTTGQGWTFVERETGVNGGTAIINASQSATKLFGLFGGSEGGDMPFRLADNSGQSSECPTLTQMAQAAINVLSDDPDGFLLMIEGGAIDHGSHNNNIDQMIGETIGFNEAVSAVVAWIDANDPTWTDTLLIVTADHETGYLSKGSGVKVNVALGNPGAGILPTSGVHYYWNSGGHTNSLVPVYAKGSGSELLTSYATSHDTLFNIDYLDNTNIFQTLYSAIAP